ncbi:MAG: twin-arginine translocase subunit TatC [Candidatus Nomurabacteria bacterium]|nr:twin-arginine translocase subunit TatC [Candidatus Nomurabacteria bacterium]
MNSLKQLEEKSIFEHIGELRKRIFIVIGAITLGTIIAHIFNKEIVAFVLRPATGQHLIFLSPLESLFFIFKIDITTGIIIAFPVIVWTLFSFITPALPRKITKLLVLFFVTSIFLLILGLFYAFLVTIPFSLKFLFSIVVPGIENQISAESYISFFITQALIIALIFQVPIFITGGIYLRFFKTKTLSKKRRYIYLIITIALAVITPTVDIFNLIIVLVPCLAIFEVSLIGGKIVEMMHKKEKLEIEQI